MSGILNFSLFALLLLLTAIFSLQPGECKAFRLKCSNLNCTSDECVKGITAPTIVNCEKAQYCTKISVFEDGIHTITRGCIDRHVLFFFELSLNECEVIESGANKAISCICDKNVCNSGNGFDSPPITQPPILECLKCKSGDCPDDDSSITTGICKKGYYCYKFSNDQDKNGNWLIERGCIHNNFSSTLGLKLNECGEYEMNYKKYPICICDKNKCNSGSFPAVATSKPPSPTCDSLNSAANNLKEIWIILAIFNWIFAKSLFF